MSQPAPALRLLHCHQQEESGFLNTAASLHFQNCQDGKCLQHILYVLYRKPFSREYGKLLPTQSVAGSRVFCLYISSHIRRHIHQRKIIRSCLWNLRQDVHQQCFIQGELSFYRWDVGKRKNYWRWCFGECHAVLDLGPPPPSVYVVCTSVCIRACTHTHT